jgi:hypothetical protein
MEDVWSLFQPIAHLLVYLSFRMDAVGQFLNSQEWKITMTSFLDSHCSHFTFEEEYSLKCYAIYQEFREIVDAVLENVIQV